MARCVQRTSAKGRVQMSPNRRFVSILADESTFRMKRLKGSVIEQDAGRTYFADVGHLALWTEVSFAHLGFG